MSAASGTKVKNIALAGLCTAFMAVVAPLSIPIGPISLTLSVLGVFFAGAMLSPGWAAASILAYICIGAVGLPVFSNFQGGAGVLLGATGGYILGFLASALAHLCGPWIIPGVQTGIYLNAYNGNLYHNMTVLFNSYFPLQTWTTRDFPVADVKALGQFDLWSQSQGTTEVYFTIEPCTEFY